jgi:putative alpha-1,2-mannosidase
VRDIMKFWFNPGPLGYRGEEDNEEESSWYVLSAMVHDSYERLL